MSTAYNSLKTRLLKSEAEKQELKRELKGMHSHYREKDQSSPTMQRTPQVSSGPELALNGSHILRQKQNVACREDSNTHQRHGSWGYSNDHLRTENQYLKLMEVQINKVEEERNRLQTELKEVRLKLAEYSMKSDQVKAKEQQNMCNVSTHRELARQLAEAKERLTVLSEQNQTLLKSEKDLKCEKEVLQDKIVSCEKLLSIKKLSPQSEIEIVSGT